SPCVWPICAGVIPDGNACTCIPSSHLLPVVEKVGGVVSRASRNAFCTPSQANIATSINALKAKVNFFLQDFKNICSPILLLHCYQILRLIVSHICAPPFASVPCQWTVTMRPK